MEPEKADVVVVGGGCAGLFAARALLRRRYSVVLIGKPHIEGHASNRNFGWLQSGALEAIAKKSPDYPLECAAGMRLIEEEFPGAVHRDVVPHGLFLLDGKAAAVKFADKCVSLGIVRDAELELASRWFPGVPSDQYALKTRDSVFSPSVILGIVAREVVQHPYLRFVAHPTPDLLTIVDDVGAPLEVRDGNALVASGDTVVQTLGVHARALARATELEMDGHLVRRYTAFVASRVLGDRVVAGPFFNPDSKDAGFLIPHPEAGRTILLTGGVLEHEKSLEPDMRPKTEFAHDAFQYLWKTFPWLPKHLDGQFYVCHRFHLEHAHIARTGRVVAFYPGYFAIAPHAAERMVGFVTTSSPVRPEPPSLKDALPGPRLAVDLPISIGPMHYMVSSRDDHLKLND